MGDENWANFRVLREVIFPFEVLLGLKVYFH